MTEKFDREMQIKLTRDKKVFKCEFGDQNIKECVDLKLDPSELINKHILDCLDAMLKTCLGKKKTGINFLTSEVDISLVKNEENKFEIEEICLDLIPDSADEEILNKISQCLKFFNVSCMSKDSIKFSFSFSEPKDSLNQYKQELFTLKDQLEAILGREINDFNP
jgi:hypothetical protein